MRSPTVSSGLSVFLSARRDCQSRRAVFSWTLTIGGIAVPYFGDVKIAYSMAGMGTAGAVTSTMEFRTYCPSISEDLWGSGAEVQLVCASDSSIVTEEGNFTGYNGYTYIPTCLAIISNVTGAAVSQSPNFGKACSINTHQGESGVVNSGFGEMYPSGWLHDFIAFEDILKLPPEEWNNENLSGYEGTLLYTVNYSKSGEDAYPKSGWVSNRSGYSKTIYTKHIPDYTNTSFYALMQLAVKRGADKSNYYHNLNFYWIHNGQAWWSRDNPPYFYRNTDDLYQPGSTYEQYQMVGPPVWSDDYDDYY